MSHWRFVDYCSDDGEDFFDRWYKGQDDAVRAECDLVMYFLAVTKNWDTRKGWKALTGKHQGLWELIVKVEKINYRPLGILQEGSKQFILLTGFEKSGRVTIPPDAFDRALGLKQNFEQGLGCLHERTI